MKPSDAVREHGKAIRCLAEKHRVRNVRVFGSSLHGDDVPGSDLDLLVDPTPETTLLDLAAIQIELEGLLGMPVDVLTPKALSPSFRARVLSEAVPL